MKKIIFLTGTRADYGKMKPLMMACEKAQNLEAFIYISGMHLLAKYGNTYMDIEKDGYKNIRLQKNMQDIPNMDINCANLILDFSEYVREIKPDIIIVHGDRIDALGGAIVGMLNNILLGHIEGGEITGTVDEAIRHAISKMANLHFVSNRESAIRIKQLGENEQNIYVIGSPDIDIMLSNDLPKINTVKEKYNIKFNNYGIFIYHPVVSEINRLDKDIKEINCALLDSKQNFIVIYPNNDMGSEIILDSYRSALTKNNKFIFYPSISFEDFLILLKNANFVIGNSSCGIREACVYGIPAIDIGTRQKNRYSLSVLPNIQHVEANYNQIIEALDNLEYYKVKSSYYGDGNSAKRFLKILENPNLWKANTQKQFIDVPETIKEIEIYHNEVCF